MELFNIICGVCSIIGLLVSLFTAGTVVKTSHNVKNVIKRCKIKEYVGGDNTQVNNKQ